MEGDPLFALGFRFYSEEQLRRVPRLVPLLDALTSGTKVFARTQLLGIGNTVLRDEQGRLRMAEGQFDMAFKGFQERPPRLA